MNAFNKIKTLALLAGAVFLSAPPAFAEDIEIYLYENENSGANVLLLIDNSGGTNRKFPGTAYSDGSPAKTIDEIAFALREVISSVAGNTRLGVSAQLAGGTNGGAIFYPVKQISETVTPSAYAAVNSVDDEASQIFNLNGATLPQPINAAKWEATADTSSDTLPFPSILSTSNDESVLAVTLSGLSVPRYAQVDSAVLSFSSPSKGNDATNKFEARVTHEVNDTPATITDLSTLTWGQGFDTDHNATGTFSEGTLRLDVTKAVQAAVANPKWCGNQDLRLMIMASDIPAANVPEIYTRRATDADGGSLGRTELNVDWNASASIAPPAGTTSPDDKSCMGGVTITLDGANDDAVETDGGSNLKLAEPELLLENDTKGNDKGNYVGAIRFSTLTFARNTVVSNAILSGKINSASGASPEFTVKAMLGDVADFSVGDISGSSTGTKSVAVSATTGEFTADVTDLINEAFSDASWASGNSLGLKLERTGGDSIRIHAIDGGAASGMTITMDIIADKPSAFGSSFDRKAEMQVAVDTFSNASGGGKNKPASSYAEAATYMLGTDPVYGQTFSHIDAFENSSRTNYLSPGEAYSSCGGNHIIMVTHAESSGESFKPAIDKITGNSNCPGDGNGDAWACSKELSGFLKGNDIITHTIAFAPQKQETYDGLKAVAQASGGVYQEAADAQELATKLSDLIDSLTTTDASMAAPGVAVNQLNRFKHLNQLYYALFRPDFVTRWNGNLKRYGVDTDTDIITDENGIDAVDTDGFFKDEASSWWSDVVDGGDITLGGSRAQTLANGNRKLLLARTSPAPSGSNTATNKVTGQTPSVINDIGDLSKAELGLDATATDTDMQEHLDFLLTEWGDPLHTQPRLVNYGYTGTFEEAEKDPSKQTNVVFVATNDGMLHAVDPEDGSEHFAFIPGEELAKTASRYDPVDLDTADPRRGTYGLDGGITVWRRSNADDPSANPEHVFLYVGQRRGGDSYYAIDATNKTSPTMMWEINSDQAGFSNLGQTWSTPTLTQISLGGTRVPVLVFGGGYSPTDHDDKNNVSSGDTVGNSIYMVNAFTGKLIWSASSGTNSDMKWAIPASVSAVDIDFDGLVDYLYAADLGGQVFRIDVNSSATDTNNLVTRVATLAKLGTSDASGRANHRRFFAAPVVALNARSDGTPFLQVGLGSGYRSYPLDQQTTNYIYAIDDYDAMDNTASSAITASDLLDVTNDTSPDEASFSGKKGWMIKLEGNGEKTLSSGVVVDGVMHITSYLPDSAFQDACNRVVGKSKLYSLNIIDGSPALDFNNDGNLERSTDLTLPGLPPSPQVLLDGSDETTLIIGTEALEGSSLNAGKGVRKTRWYQVDTKTEADDALDK